MAQVGTLRVHCGERVNGHNAAMTERGDMSVTRRDDATLVIHLSGSWQLTTGLPSSEIVRRELSNGSARAVAFETEKLRKWDSAVVTFLARVMEICREKGIAVDPEGLPAGVRRLLRLAEAVPEKPGTRKAGGRAPWIERLGATALGLWNANRDTLAFLGETTLSIGRLARGRARLRGSDLAVLIQECGAQALPIVTLISVLVGMILAFVGAVQLERFGAQMYVADLVAIAMVREMGCIMTGIIMAGRTGSGFAAQLGT
ncbi:MAG: ABC transporter permease, partial [Candidatus Binatia bacterium]